MLRAPVYTSYEDLKEWREAMGPRRIVCTNGCFDLLHRGHVEHLEQAAAYGDILAIGLNSDASVRKLKGPTRPVQTERDRAYILSALSCVHMVFIFNGKRATRFLAEVRPHVYVKGGDYSIENMDASERRTLERCGCFIKFLPRIGGYSTTAILKAR